MAKNSQEEGFKSLYVQLPWSLYQRLEEQADSEKTAKVEIVRRALITELDSNKKD